MKEGMKKYNTGGTKLFLIVLSAAAAVVILICILFVYNIRQTTEKETERYLTELSASVVYSVDARLEANLDALESIAASYVEMKKLGPLDMTYIQKKAQIHKFESVYIMGLDGKAAGADGEPYDFSETTEIMAALDGKRVVVNDAAIYGQTRNGFAYAVPIYENDVITGAVVAGNTTEWIKNLLDQTYFEGNGFFHIIDANGNFVVKSSNSFAMSEKKNFFYGLQKDAQFTRGTSLEELKKLVVKNERGTVYFSMREDNVPKIGKIIPTGHPGFYLFLVVLEKAASHQFDTLLSQAVWSNVLISLMFLCLVAALFVTSQKSSRKLSRLAFVDPVTGGFSRVRFELEAQERVQAAAPGTYVFVSLNVTKFKWVNDTFGSNKGDLVLKHIHKAITKYLSNGELLCRSSADHFDLLLTSRSQEEMLLTVGKIVQEINGFNEQVEKKYYLPLTAGVYRINDPELPIVHIRDRADVARKNSRAAMDQPLFSCGFYSDSERQRQLREKALENKMSAALKNHEFKVYLQPKVNLKSGRIAGAEALVRWLDAEWGLLPPNEFIPLFEKNGFIVQLDLYMFEETCRIIRGWIDAGKEPVPVSVNLSRMHLYNGDFLKNYIAIRQKYGVAPSLLEIELTETLLFENFERVTQVIEEIHQAGFHCSIDDFGSGYSSLNLLKEIKADILKLDGSFFRSFIKNDPRGCAIIESVVEMAQKLSMETVAEGVETPEQVEFLKDIRCDMIQGYVISKPVEQASFEKLAFGQEVSADKE